MKFFLNVIEIRYQPINLRFFYLSYLAARNAFTIKIKFGLQNFERNFNFITIEENKISFFPSNYNKFNF